MQSVSGLLIFNFFLLLLLLLLLDYLPGCLWQNKSQVLTCFCCCFFQGVPLHLLPSLFLPSVPVAVLLMIFSSRFRGDRGSRNWSAALQKQTASSILQMEQSIFSCRVQRTFSYTDTWHSTEESQLHVSILKNVFHSLPVQSVCVCFV